MGFISKGENIILKPGSGSIDGTYLYKVMTQNGSFIDDTYGDLVEDFETPITSSTWTTYEVFRYLNLGMVRQVYSDVHSFNRNMRFDSTLRLSNTVVPTGSDLSGVSYITALVRGSLTDDVSTITQRLIDEFSTNTYNYVIAIGTLARDISDYRAIDVDVNDIKTFNGTALITHDYDLSTDEAVYLTNIAIISNADAESITSLSMNVYKQTFIEYLGDNFVVPGSIGKTEMNPDYKAERALNSFVFEVDDGHIVDGVLILSPDYTTQIDNNTIYYMNVIAKASFTKVSLGYYDTMSEVYVPNGTEYTVSGTASGLCIAFVHGTDIIFKQL